MVNNHLPEFTTLINSPTVILATPPVAMFHKHISVTLANHPYAGDQSAIRYAASCKDTSVIVDIAKMMVLDNHNNTSNTGADAMHPDSAATWLEIIPSMLGGEEHALVALRVLRVLLPILEQLVDTAISFATALGAEVIPDELYVFFVTYLV